MKKLPSTFAITDAGKTFRTANRCVGPAQHTTLDEQTWAFGQIRPHTTGRTPRMRQVRHGRHAR